MNPPDMSAGDIEELKKIGYLPPTFRGWHMIDTLPDRPHQKECGIINADKDGNNGTHWVCYNIDDKAEYFDSYGAVPDERTVAYLEKSGRPIYYNNRQIQQLDSNLCGPYVCYYLHKRGQGVEPYDILAEFDAYPSNKNQMSMLDIANYINDLRAEGRLAPDSRNPDGGCCACGNRTTGGVLGTFNYAASSDPAATALGGAALLAVLAGLAGKSIYKRITGSGFSDFVKMFSINNLLTEEKIPFELHAIDRGDDGKIQKASFCGPATKLENRLVLEGKPPNARIKAIKTQPINMLDRACMRHDVSYLNKTELPDRHKADAELAKVADAVAKSSTSRVQRANARLVSAIMNDKIKRNW